MPRFIDLTGQSFGLLTVVSQATHSGAGRVRWLCRCGCGVEKIFQASALRNGQKSCGNKHRTGSANPRWRDGIGKHPLYNTWVLMLRRCQSANKDAPYYFDRGITVYPAWEDSAAFLAYVDTHLGPRPPGHSLDRIDNDAPYRPGNLRWATRSEQGRNQRSNRLLTFHGETRSIAEWAERIGIGAKAIRARLDLLGWSVEKTLTTPVQDHSRRRRHRATPCPSASCPADSASV